MRSAAVPPGSGSLPRFRDPQDSDGQRRTAGDVEVWAYSVRVATAITPRAHTLMGSCVPCPTFVETSGVSVKVDPNDGEDHAYLIKGYRAVGVLAEVTWTTTDWIRTPDDARSPYLYTGRKHDPETGLMYYRTRYYDTEMGRFISKDTIGVWEDPNSLGNGYSYVASMPHRGTDPSGEICILNWFSIGKRKCHRAEIVDCASSPCWEVGVNFKLGVAASGKVCYNDLGQAAITLGGGVGVGAGASRESVAKCNPKGFAIEWEGACSAKVGAALEIGFGASQYMGDDPEFHGAIGSGTVMATTSEGVEVDFGGACSGGAYLSFTFEYIGPSSPPDPCLEHVRAGMAEKTTPQMCIRNDW